MAPQKNLDLTFSGLRERFSEIKSIFDESNDANVVNKGRDDIEMTISDLHLAWEKNKAAYYELCVQFTPEERN